MGYLNKYLYQGYLWISYSSQPGDPAALRALQRLRARVATALFTPSFATAMCRSSVSATERPPRRGLPRPNCHSHWLISWPGAKEESAGARVANKSCCAWWTLCSGMQNSNRNAISCWISFAGPEPDHLTDLWHDRTWIDMAYDMKRYTRYIPNAIFLI